MKKQAGPFWAALCSKSNQGIGTESLMAPVESGGLRTFAWQSKSIQKVLMPETEKRWTD